MTAARRAPTHLKHFPIAAPSHGSEALLDRQELIPDLDRQVGRYRLRFARTQGDLEEAQRLRYRVFNLELGEGLADAHIAGRDADEFDAQCQHLLVIEAATDTVVGTYRMQAASCALEGAGWYSAGEFQLDGLPLDDLAAAAELGRACIDAEHRDRTVLLLLWRGLMAYLEHNSLRAFFGCSSLTGTDPLDGAALYRDLVADGRQHPRLHAAPLDTHACPLEDDGREAEIPKLFGIYLRQGAHILGPPAVDAEFGTIDFLTWVDVTGEHRRRFG